MKAWIAAAWANLSTTIPGVIAFLLGISGVIQALDSWANGQPVNWRMTVVSIAIAVGGIGHVNSKSGTTHSTVAQVEQSTIDVADAKPMVKL